MTIHTGFAPDAARARALDRRMHAELAASLRHVCERSRGIVPFDEKGMGRLIGSLQAATPHSPLVFARYYALVTALLENDDREAAALFERLSSASPASPEQTVAPLDEPHTSARGAVYRDMMTGDEDAEIGIVPPRPDVAAAFRERYRRAMALVDEVMPELGGEIRAIVREVVLVAADPARDTVFQGGSHFQLWGALFLNAELHPTVEAVVEVVAHESAHSLLFGFCTEEPLVHNPDEDLYPSPLRADPRPMDGIYHATFVSARMHRALSRLIESGRLSEESQAGAIRARTEDRNNFEAGYRVVAEHGDLSGVGRALMDGARAYMDAAPG